MMAATGSDTVGEVATVDPVKTFYASAVGMMGLGKLAGANATTPSTPHKVIFEDACPTTTDLKTPESLTHVGTLYSPIEAAIDTKDVGNVPCRRAGETECCHKPTLVPGACNS